MQAEQQERGEWQRGLHGDREAFGALFELHATALYNLAYRLTGTPADAQDLVQSAVLRALNSATQCQDVGHFRAWMRTIITHLFLDQCKARQRAGREHLVETHDWTELETHIPGHAQPKTPRQELERTELERHVARALQCLSPEARMVVVLRDVEGLSYQEIAGLETIPVETVRTRLRRAREQLRHLMPFLSPPHEHDAEKMSS